ncbi:MAG: 3-oxoacyl-ACP reductase FabG [Thermoguttaceae bacterium]
MYSLAMRLAGKIALVTGGSRGIGRAVVEKLSAEGAEVVFVFQSNREAADALAAELVAQGRKVRALQADVRDAARAQQVIDEIIEKSSRVDVLVNSAGIVRDGLLGAMTADQWRDVVETNLFGTYNYCRAVAQQMMYQRSGSIVNLSSTASEFASRGQVNYAASKGGIDGLTRAMAKEFAQRKIRVNAVAPGMIETDMSKAIRGLVGDKIKEYIPLKRIGTPADVANVVAFLAGDEASYITGQVLRVDGGLSLGGY